MGVEHGAVQLKYNNITPEGQFETLTGQPVMVFPGARSPDPLFGHSGQRSLVEDLADNLRRTPSEFT